MSQTAIQTIRAISLWQPWATLLISGAKRFETRSWPLPQYRLPFLCAIHAAKKKDHDSIRLCFDEPFRTALLSAGINTPGDMPFGAVVGIVRFDACYPTESRELGRKVTPDEIEFGDFRFGRFAWEAEVIERFAEPIPARGAQGFWSWTREAQQ